MAQVKWEFGEVLWFDEYGGEGELRAEDGKSYYFHFSALDSDKKWKSVDSNKKVKFKPSEDPQRPHAARVKEL